MNTSIFQISALLFISGLFILISTFMDVRNKLSGKEESALSCFFCLAGLIFVITAAILGDVARWRGRLHPANSPDMVYTESLVALIAFLVFIISFNVSIIVTYIIRKKLQNESLPKRSSAKDQIYGISRYVSLTWLMLLAFDRLYPWNTYLGWMHSKPMLIITLPAVLIFLVLGFLKTIDESVEDT